MRLDRAPVRWYALRMTRDVAETALLEAVRSGSGRDIRAIRFKDNRVRLLSLSRDGATLYLHRSFRDAPAVVVDAIATFLRARPGTAASAAASARIRGWAAAAAKATNITGSPGHTGPAAAPRAPRPGPCCGTPAQRRFLAELYRDLNHRYCAGRLPAELPLRFSNRMRRRLGHVRCHRTPTGERTVVELALNIDLMAEGNERQLRETMLHELAHVEAWLLHGDRGHGRHWRRIARRLGCPPRACTAAPVPLRRPGSRPTTRVPPGHLVV